MFRISFAEGHADFLTLAQAKEFAQEIFECFDVIVGIEEV